MGDGVRFTILIETGGFYVTGVISIKVLIFVLFLFEVCCSRQSEDVVSNAH